ncbi:UDP-N-acetylglucosamine 2-epimerase (non-hydrolyzing) [Methanofollis formosanus]|uniref:UDP-N-acetylglucosamine 2-epimerase (Non-hydrolyzing) n=1 Tax=Methanofollis formosanus TaxID=299308 RepID=A0A8G0ZZS6_9EURY|nr:UDP-N-acetylglucosamine 2-epimerase (non-hydrolyzing) [Methanofollis formosanus]QYZ78455.1 UDP-N-acetylglucosamine 2-epimerase (non-hydrolyzing) [Methanofollis formosanus]
MTEKSPLKVMTILGTRPEIIRLSRVMVLLDRHVQHIIVHTGQNYDYELNEVFFKDLEIRKPDYFLQVDTGSLGTVLGDTLIKIEGVLRKEKPDAVLILGDTNSSIAGIMAKRLKIPIFHMEAGNRCFDFNVPEEINRRIIDHIADFNLVYTEHARRHLLSEGLPHRRIYLTGSPMYEVLTYYRERIDASEILRELDLQKKGYFVVSIHREENVDNPENLEKILAVLNRLAERHDVPVIVSTHPRTRKRLEALQEVEMDPRIRFLKPFGFFDYVHLEMHALCTISDSGTISEESADLSFPAATIREAMERPEALDAGSIILTGLDVDTVLDAVGLVMAEGQERAETEIPAEYQIPDTSWRVLKLILGTAKLSNTWAGIREPVR